MKPALASRPIVELPRSGVEWVLEVASALGLLASFALVGWSWARLPARVPMHFNVAGEVDGWGPKASLLALPVTATVICLGLTLLSRFPHIFNYPWPITPDNAGRQYRLARLLLASLKLILVVLFFFLALAVCGAALGRGSLGLWFLPVGVGGVFVVIGAYIVAAYRAR